MTCYPIRKRNETTKQRGYGHDHRTASERYRTLHPLCECCVMSIGVLDAKPSEELHHVVAIADAPHERMQASNWLALCRDCHELLERDIFAGQKVKRWSEANYEDAINGGLVYG